MYLHINGRRVSQFEYKLELASELKSKPLHNLTPHKEPDLENILIGEELQGEIIGDDIDSEGEENAEKWGEVGEDSEEDDEFWSKPVNYCKVKTINADRYGKNPFFTVMYP